MDHLDLDIMNFLEHLEPQYCYDWCIIKKCQYSRPTLVSYRLSDDAITVTEYGLGEYTYTIDLKRVLMFGHRKDLSAKLKIFNEISGLLDGIEY